MRFPKRAIGLALVFLGAISCGGDSGSTTGPQSATVAKVSVAADKSSIYVGANAVLVATATDAAGAAIIGRAITWSSSDATVADVTATGFATGKRAGATTVSATIDGITGTATLNVAVPRVNSVEIIGAPSSPLFAGQSTPLSVSIKDTAGAPLSGRPVAWSSSDSTIATVTITGVVGAVGLGAATISATSGTKTGTAPISVAVRSVASISLTPTPMRVAIGGTAPLTVTARDQQGGSLAGQSYTFESSDPSVATVSALGIVSGVRAGTATLTARSQAIAGTTTLTVLAPTALAGRAFPADGGSAAGLAITAQIGAGTSLQAFSALLDGAGAFSLGAPLTSAAGDSLDLMIDVASGTRSYHPVDVRIPNTRAVTVAARPLLVPRTSSFSSMTFGVTSADVSLVQAFTRVCSDDSNANCNSFFPQVWKTLVPPLWSDADLPVALAFNRSATTGAISAADSVALWTIIHQMESDVGRPLFKPVNFSDVSPPNAGGFSDRAVLVWVDNTLTGFSGYTNWIWDVSSINLLSAKTRVANVSFLANRSLMTHELLHALGFHHTCAWTTVMGGYGCTSASGATKPDVAAFHLAYAVRRTMNASVPTTGLADALLGEQRFETGSVADRIGGRLSIPFAGRAYRTLVIGGRMVTVDGAP